MAKVNFGTIANDARGKINGIVYSKNKSGSYTRRKVSGANPNTSYQSAVRTNFAVLSQYWGTTLTEPQRAAWRAYAATYPRQDVFGNSIQISGMNMFISLNQVLLQTGGSIAVLPPASNVVTPMQFDTSSINVSYPSTLEFNQTGDNGDPDSKFYIFATAPTPPGRQPEMNKFRYIATIPSHTGSYPYNITVWAEWTARFGAQILNQRISLLIATVNVVSGLTTPGTIMSGIST